MRITGIALYLFCVEFLCYQLLLGYGSATVYFNSDSGKKKLEKGDLQLWHMCEQSTHAG